MSLTFFNELIFKYTSYIVSAIEFKVDPESCITCKSGSELYSFSLSPFSTGLMGEGRSSRIFFKVIVSCGLRVLPW